MLNSLGTAPPWDIFQHPWRKGREETFKNCFCLVHLHIPSKVWDLSVSVYRKHELLPHLGLAEGAVPTSCTDYYTKKGRSYRKEHQIAYESLLTKWAAWLKWLRGGRGKQRTLVRNNSLCTETLNFPNGKPSRISWKEPHQLPFELLDHTNRTEKNLP